MLILIARRLGARLCTCDFRGRPTVAMVYCEQPIIDYFRVIDRDRLLGLMQRRGMAQPFFFLLEREPVSESGPVQPPFPGKWRDIGLTDTRAFLRHPVR